MNKNQIRDARLFCATVAGFVGVALPAVAQESSKPSGVPVGPMVAYPEVDLTFKSNDNIYSQPASGTRKSSNITVIAPKIGGVRGDDDGPIAAGAAFSGAPLVLFDAVVLALGPGGGAALAREAAAVDFVRDAFGHLKVIGFTEHARPLLDAAGLAAKSDAGCIGVGGKGAVAAFVEAVKHGRIWAREPKVRTSP